MKQNNQLLSSAPYFPVADLERSVVYYERVLGFKRDTEREPTANVLPRFVVVRREGLAIVLHDAGDDNPGPNTNPGRRHADAWDVYFWVRDVHALHAELHAAGADVMSDPIVRPYRMEEFSVRDADGNVLGFGQAL
jgi:catechol 2,3-dioxygenase-like lactoylglutathione lyase family enzyme